MIPTPDELTATPAVENEQIHIYELRPDDSTSGGYRFHGIRYEAGRRPVTVYDDNLESLKKRLR